MAVRRKSGVYVLRLQRGECYYVGSSGDVEQRVENHMNNPQVGWVIDHGGVAEVLEPVTPPEEPLSAWEMRETMARMIMHGFNNVRGWEYCSPHPLGSSDVDGIFKIICGGLSVPLCHSCGFSGHLSSNCTTQGRAVWLDSLMACRPEKKVTGSDVILGLIRDGGTVPHPKRKGSPLDEERHPAVLEERLSAPSAAAAPSPEACFVSYNEIAEQQQGPVKYQRRGNIGCIRCGRVCHQVERCYARTNVNGEQIAPVSGGVAASAR